MEDTALIIGIVRDIAFLTLFLVVILAALVLYRRLSTLVDSATRTMKEMESIFSTVSAKVVGPAAAGSGVAFGAGKVMAFLLGLRRKRKKGGGNDGE